MRLYHWTWQNNVESIREEGFRPSPTSNPFYDGVHTYTDPILGRGQWGDVCFFGDVPDGELDITWRKERNPTSRDWMWVLPFAVATEHLRRVSETPEVEST